MSIKKIPVSARPKNIVQIIKSKADQDGQVELLRASNNVVQSPTKKHRFFVKKNAVINDELKAPKSSYFNDQKQMPTPKQNYQTEQVEKAVFQAADLKWQTNNIGGGHQAEKFQRYKSTKESERPPQMLTTVDLKFDTTKQAEKGEHTNNQNNPYSNAHQYKLNLETTALKQITHSLKQIRKRSVLKRKQSEEKMSSIEMGGHQYQPQPQIPQTHANIQINTDKIVLSKQSIVQKSSVATSRKSGRSNNAVQTAIENQSMAPAKMKSRFNSNNLDHDEGQQNTDILYENIKASNNKKIPQSTKSLKSLKSMSSHSSQPWVKPIPLQNQNQAQEIKTDPRDYNNVTVKQDDCNSTTKTQRVTLKQDNKKVQMALKDVLMVSAQKRDPLPENAQITQRIQGTIQISRGRRNPQVKNRTQQKGVSCPQDKIPIQNQNADPVIHSKSTSKKVTVPEILQLNDMKGTKTVSKFIDEDRNDMREQGSGSGGINGGRRRLIFQRQLEENNGFQTNGSQNRDDLIHKIIKDQKNRIKDGALSSRSKNFSLKSSRIFPNNQISLAKQDHNQVLSPIEVHERDNIDDKTKDELDQIIKSIRKDRNDTKRRNNNFNQHNSSLKQEQEFSSQVVSVIKSKSTAKMQQNKHNAERNQRSQMSQISNPANQSSTLNKFKSQQNINTARVRSVIQKENAQDLPKVITENNLELKKYTKLPQSINTLRSSFKSILNFENSKRVTSNQMKFQTQQSGRNESETQFSVQTWIQQANNEDPKWDSKQKPSATQRSEEQQPEQMPQIPHKSGMGIIVEEKKDAFRENQKRIPQMSLQVNFDSSQKKFIQKQRSHVILSPLDNKEDQVEESQKQANFNSIQLRSARNLPQIKSIMQSNKHSKQASIVKIKVKQLPVSKIQEMNSSRNSSANQDDPQKKFTFSLQNLNPKKKQSNAQRIPNQISSETIAVVQNTQQRAAQVDRGSNSTERRVRENNNESAQGHPYVQNGSGCKKSRNRQLSISSQNCQEDNDKSGDTTHRNQFPNHDAQNGDDSLKKTIKFQGSLEDQKKSSLGLKQILKSDDSVKYIAKPTACKGQYDALSNLSSIKKNSSHKKGNEMANNFSISKSLSPSAKQMKVRKFDLPTVSRNQQNRIQERPSTKLQPKTTKKPKLEKPQQELQLGPQRISEIPVNAFQSNQDLNQFIDKLDEKFQLFSDRASDKSVDELLLAIPKKTQSIKDLKINKERIKSMDKQVKMKNILSDNNKDEIFGATANLNLFSQSSIKELLTPLKPTEGYDLEGLLNDVSEFSKKQYTVEHTPRHSQGSLKNSIKFIQQELPLSQSQKNALENIDGDQQYQTKSQMQNSFSSVQILMKLHKQQQESQPYRDEPKQVIQQEKVQFYKRETPDQMVRPFEMADIEDEIRFNQQIDAIDIMHMDKGQFEPQTQTQDSLPRMLNLAYNQNLLPPTLNKMLSPSQFSGIDLISNMNLSQGIGPGIIQGSSQFQQQQGIFQMSLQKSQISNFHQEMENFFPPAELIYDNHLSINKISSARSYRKSSMVLNNMARRIDTIPQDVYNFESPRDDHDQLPKLEEPKKSHLQSLQKQSSQRTPLLSNNYVDTITVNEDEQIFERCNDNETILEENFSQIKMNYLEMTENL